MEIGIGMGIRMMKGKGIETGIGTGMKIIAEIGKGLEKGIAMETGM